MKRKEIHISNHAKEQMVIRNITVEEVNLVLTAPDSVQNEISDISVFQKVLQFDNKPYLYRVFVNTGRVPPLVVTAYKTSKIEKYEDKVR